MENLISKVKGVKSHLEQNKKTKIEYFDTAKDIYYDAKKIPLKSNFVRYEEDEVLLDGKFKDRPEAFFTSEKLWDIFNYSTKVRFFISNRNSRNLVSCNYSIGDISVFINCDQLEDYQLCKDSSVIYLGDEIYRIPDNVLYNLTWCVVKFYESYYYYSHNSPNGEFDVSVIQVKNKKKKTLTEKVMDYIYGINLPNIEKYLQLLNSSHLNDDYLEKSFLKNKKYEIQKIYP